MLVVAALHSSLGTSAGGRGQAQAPHARWGGRFVLWRAWARDACACRLEVVCGVRFRSFPPAPSVSLQGAAALWWLMLCVGRSTGVCGVILDSRERGGREEEQERERGGARPLKFSLDSPPRPLHLHTPKRTAGPFSPLSLANPSSFSMSALAAQKSGVVAKAGASKAAPLAPVRPAGPAARAVMVKVRRGCRLRVLAPVLSTHAAARLRPAIVRESAAAVLQTPKKLTEHPLLPPPQKKQKKKQIAQAARAESVRAEAAKRADSVVPQVGPARRPLSARANGPSERARAGSGEDPLRSLSSLSVLPLSSSSPPSVSPKPQQASATAAAPAKKAAPAKRSEFELYTLTTWLLKVRARRRGVRRPSPDAGAGQQSGRRGTALTLPPPPPPKTNPQTPQNNTNKRQPTNN
jgi:hypothetical protein